MTPASARHYLDCASTAPLRPEARAAMVEWLEGPAADPARAHAEGRRARAAIEEARERVAALVGATGREVVFTSGATESIVTASWGAADDRGAHVVYSAVEHAAVRMSAERCFNSVVAADGEGRIDPTELKDAATANTGLVHCQWANHEFGTLQPVRGVVEAFDDRPSALIHVDAAAAVGQVPIAFDELGIDLMSFSGHKFGGPTGVGALVVRKGLRLPSLMVGGDQERGRRAGLENLAAIAGFGAAAETAREQLTEYQQRARHLTEMAMDAIAHAEGVRRIGSDKRVPQILAIELADVHAEPLLLALDANGIAVHSGGSCSSESLEPSPVLAALDVDPDRSLRISVGWSTTEADVGALADSFGPEIAKLRSLGN